jgi:hypothetical protein
VIILWTFESQAKLEQFAVILRSHDISFEVLSKNPKKTTSGEATISVDEKDYDKAKRILVRHRKRRTSGDYK